MEKFRIRRAEDGSLRIQTRHYGQRLLTHAIYNKGSAFSVEEREVFGLNGLLPAAVASIEQQERRFYDNILRKGDPLEKHIGLAALHDRNEHLFYRVLIDNLEEFLPIVYTPTVGRACQSFSHIFRRARGLWITPEHQGQIFEVLGNAPFEDVRLIVVTDNERILGLGDQGAGGMGIPVGKLALYTAAAGIHPTQTLPVSLDVGTDNQALLADDLYLGWRHPRLRGEGYDILVDEFVRAVMRRFPQALLQWEDFKKGNAFRLLGRYRTLLPSFNDDIQGTAAVVLAALMAAGRLTGGSLGEQRILILGAGAAGIGIAWLLREALGQEGLSHDSVVQRIAILDSHGLLVDDTAIADVYKRDYAWPAALAAHLGLGPGQARDLEAVVRAFKPTIMIGTSGEPGVFSESVVREMAAHVARPVILPLSNPTSQAEATPANLLAWTEGRALVATGSPFPPVSQAGGTIRTGQANNAFVFPGIGLGCLVAQVREVTDALFAAAARALAQEISDADLAQGGLLPRTCELRRVTVKVAEAVVRAAVETGVGCPIDDVPQAVAAAMWDPRYLPLERV